MFWMLWVSAVVLCLVYLHGRSRPSSGAPSCRIGPLCWDRSSFCRGWLVTGATGSGKTQFLTRLLREVTLCERAVAGRPAWGGLLIDEKGDWLPVVRAVLDATGRGGDLRLLTGPEYGRVGGSWRLNPLEDPAFSPTGLARAFVRAAQGVHGDAGDQAFFRVQAQGRIADLLEVLRGLRRAMDAGALPPADITASPRLILRLLGSDDGYLDWLASVGVDPSGSDDPRLEAVHVWLGRLRDRHWALPRETLGGVQATLENILGPLSGDAVHALLGGSPNLRIQEMDAGRLLLIGLPQSLALERRVVAALLKQLWYQHARQRFDLPLPASGRNLLVLWQDEAQRFIQAEDGDVDILRGADATTILACQSKLSLHPPLGGREKAEPIILNLRNRVVFRAADETCAKETAEFIGRRLEPRRTTTTGRGGRSTSLASEEGFRVRPHTLRSLPDFGALVMHATGTWRALRLPPLGADGKPPSWWRPGLVTRLLRRDVSRLPLPSRLL